MLVVTTSRKEAANETTPRQAAQREAQEAATEIVYGEERAPTRPPDTISVDCSARGLPCGLTR